MAHGALRDRLCAETRRWWVPGVQLGLLTPGGRTVVCAGSLDLADSRRVDRSTSFHVASITKSLTALVVLDAARRGEIDIDRPCSEQAEGLWDDSPRSLMAHTSGRASELPDEGESLDDCISRVAGLPLVHEQGRFSYGNAGWIVLDALLRKTTGASFEERAQDLLGTSLTFGIPPTGALGHAVRPGRRPEACSSDQAPLSAATGGRWWTTADFLLDYAEVHLTDGSGRFHPDDVEELRRPQVRVPGAVIADAWGLGWAIWDRGEHRAFGWFGYLPGHQTFIRCFPDQGAAVVLLTNCAGPLLGGGGGAAMFASLLPTLLEALGVPPLPRPRLPDRNRSTADLSGTYDDLVVESDGEDSLVLHAAALGEDEPALLDRAGGDTFVVRNRMGSLDVAFDGDLLYLGPFAMSRRS